MSSLDPETDIREPSEKPGPISASFQANSQSGVSGDPTGNPSPKVARVWRKRKGARTKLKCGSRRNADQGRIGPRASCTESETL